MHGLRRRLSSVHCKSAGFAQHFAYQVLAVVEQGAVRQDQRATPLAFVVAAVRAGAEAALFGETAGAQVSKRCAIHWTLIRSTQ